ncbi:putative tyrosine protein phosphatase MIH1 [Aspergillus clavatus NRRL 1]|uniref:M-phase inducer phosphatase n=1 Tax=Aspergillus clavatus (strain ATCC 1007 / CBS 513.65 / DSM 816 / NCTC 3887 / NRRL 1 / QM 1276 / 107) TaxID=344612 RepID=A1CTB9_ASPCL|nr:mitotic inducer phosphatase cdc25 [Aspergillus clavatus NRRL 1]EAW06556.1 mitotic inducer phosphatase cdc25 [Aspergillus clavatus NRRL 1]
MGTNTFNFKDLSMKKPPGDYFGMKPVSGSSPAASLAADLSQNFHIDQSPQLATPRRSLFSSNLFGHGNARGYIEDTMTTPPLPSSSPAPIMETMEMSPLPHKTPFIVTTEIDLNALTPTGSPMDSPMMSTAPSPLQDSPSMGPKEDKLERKRPSLLRPSLSRSKAQSFQLGMIKPAPESQAPPFKFHSKGNKTSLSASTSLEDMFGESPQRERPAIRNPGTLLSNPRLRPPFASNGSHVRGNGSPSAASIRKNSHPLMRPRKQCRRSLSMFEHPEDVIVEKEANYITNAPLQSITDIESTPSLQLPHFVPEEQADTLPRIDKTILVDLMDGKYNDRFDHILVIDCRFEYEYEGGHINGAVNFNDKEYLAAELFADPKPRTALILHCEYSAHRAPIMAKYIRHRDRAVNVDQYPQLTYPDMYILHGGYSAFFADHQALCFPQNYVEMSAKEHEYACERGLGKVKQRSKLGRAQTFAFGQHSPQMEDSPTGRCRNNPGERIRFLDSPFEGTPTSGRGTGRRMLSY